MILSTKTKLGLVAVGAVTATFAATLPAHADYAPRPADVVGVGGDTPQYDLSFGADGDTVGDLGYNAAGNVNRLVTFNATADANGRQAYADGSTLASPILLNPTIVLREGTHPVQRPSSSGQALSAIAADTSHEINFVFSASFPTGLEQTTVGNQHTGDYLHVVQLGTDAVQAAVDTTTNAPATLDAADLIKIYDGSATKWTDVGGTSSDTIIPLLPPKTSSIYKTFLAYLQQQNGNVAITVGGDVKTVEQNDPTAITGQAGSADAIVPFSAARFSLFNSGYFTDPTAPFPGGATITPGIKLIPASSFTAPVDHYVVFRESDTTDPAFQPGGTLNWVQTLFSNPGGIKPFFDRGTGQALLKAAGITPDYKDLGEQSSG